jgi:hypothetical protein
MLQTKTSVLSLRDTKEAENVSGHMSGYNNHSDHDTHALPDCIGQGGFDAGYGGCDTYAPGSHNHDHCDGDGATQACHECGECAQTNTLALHEAIVKLDADDTEDDELDAMGDEESVFPINEIELDTPDCTGAPAPIDTAAPAQHFQLLPFKLQTDLHKCNGRSGVREIKWPEMSNFSYSGFYMDLADHAMVFITNVNGSTTSTKAIYPRTELREEHQWDIHSGQHYMNGRFSVNRLPAGKESVVVAQVKPGSFSAPFLKLRATVRGSTRPAYALEARVKVNGENGSIKPREISLKFKRKFQLGELLDFNVTVSHLMLTVTVAAVGEAAQTVTHDYRGVSVFDKNPGDLNYYFKAGSYCQSNHHKSPLGEQCEVRISTLEIKHQ